MLGERGDKEVCERGDITKRVERSAENHLG